VIDLFQLLQSLAEPNAARRGPGRLAADDDQMNIATGGWIGPLDFEPTLGIVGKQYRSRDFGAVSGLHIGEFDVL
jgi:hypothetical protein